MPKRAFLTGITGFVGSHLAELLLDEGISVYGLARWRSPRRNIKGILGQIQLIEGDLTDLPSLERAIKIANPDYVFHLAAQSYVPASWQLPIATLNSNVIGTTNLLEAIRTSGLNPVVHLAGSSEEYGQVHFEELPIKETNPLRPLSPYGVSKVATDLLGYQYHNSYGMKVVRTRAFNHTGPRRGEQFVTSSIAKQIAEIIKRKRDIITLGSLDSIRDFTDVRDIVRAYLLAVRKCEYGEVYNLSSDKGISIQEVVNIFDRIQPHLKIKTRIDEALFRPSDVKVLIGDSTKFRTLTGWDPQIPLEKTFEDMVEFWLDYTDV